MKVTLSHSKNIYKKVLSKYKSKRKKYSTLYVFAPKLANLPFERLIIFTKSEAQPVHQETNSEELKDNHDASSKNTFTLNIARARIT